jgi:hypothetical protein
MSECNICLDSKTKKKLYKCKFCMFSFHRGCVKSMILQMETTNYNNCPVCKKANFCCFNTKRIIRLKFKNNKAIVDTYFNKLSGLLNGFSRMIYSKICFLKSKKLPYKFYEKIKNKIDKISKIVID